MFVQDNIHTIDKFSFHIHKNSLYVIELKGPLTSYAAFIFVQKILELKRNKMVFDFCAVTVIEMPAVRVLIELAKIIDIIIWNIPTSLEHYFDGKITILP